MKGTDPTCGRVPLLKRLIHGPVRLAQYTAFTIQQQLKSLPQNAKEIVFTLDEPMLYRADDGMGRYAYLTLNAFSQAGYNVYLYKNIDLKGFVKLGFYGRFIKYIKNLKIITELSRDSQSMVYAFDSINTDLLSRPWKKLVYVNILKPTVCAAGKTIWIPYYFHPHMYRLNQHTRIKELRSSQRKVRLFFGGNTVEEYYSNPNVSQNYGQMTRKEGIETLYELKDKIHSIGHVKAFLRMLQSNDYINQGWILETNKSGNTDLAQWFDFVASTDFFMCFSGTDLPMCHNSIESMAVGTIPILSYGDWFFPPLEHKKNAILYSGREDLKKKIKDVFKMNLSEIEKMRKNVIDYYDRYLSNDSFIRNFEAEQKEMTTIMLHPRLVSGAKEERRGLEFMNDLEMHLGKTGPLATHRLLIPLDVKS